MSVEAVFRDKIASAVGSQLGDGPYDPAFYSPDYYAVSTGYSRVYPVTGEQQAERPFVSYELDLLDPEVTLAGFATGASSYQFLVSIFALHYDQAAAIAQILVDAMANLRDADVRACFLVGQRGQSVPDGYCYQLTWKVIFNVE